jgi:branched-chain amino acid transport system permease protein
VRPRGLLDERLVHRIRRIVSRRPPPTHENATLLRKEVS